MSHSIPDSKDNTIQNQLWPLSTSWTDGYSYTCKTLCSISTTSRFGTKDRYIIVSMMLTNQWHPTELMVMQRMILFIFIVKLSAFSSLYIHPFFLWHWLRTMYKVYGRHYSGGWRSIVVLLLVAIVFRSPWSSYQ